MIKPHHRFRKHGMLATVFAVGTLLPSFAAAELNPFKADYRVRYLKMHAANVSLSLQQDEANWTMHRSSRAASGLARWLAGDKLKLDEQSWFKIADNSPAPHKFIQDKPGAKRGRRHIEIAFADDEAVVSTDNGGKTTYASSKNSQDQVSAVLAVMLQMSEHRENFSLPIMGRRGEDLAEFEVREIEVLKAAKHSFSTIHIVQNTEKRVTDYWLAIDYQMIPIKIRHREKGEEPAEMLLQSFTIDRPADSKN